MPNERGGKSFFKEEKKCLVFMEQKVAVVECFLSLLLLPCPGSISFLRISRNRRKRHLCQSEKEDEEKQEGRGGGGGGGGRGGGGEERSGHLARREGEERRNRVFHTQQRPVEFVVVQTPPTHPTPYTEAALDRHGHKGTSNSLPVPPSIVVKR